jgi:hypothetical protein
VGHRNASNGGRTLNKRAFPVLSHLRIDLFYNLNAKVQLQSIQIRVRAKRGQSIAMLCRLQRSLGLSGLLPNLCFNFRTKPKEEPVKFPTIEPGVGCDRQIELLMFII